MADFPSIETDETPDRIVYVRSVKTTDLPEAIQAKAEGVDHLYAIHATNGDVLALVADRAQAFIVARQNEFRPVSVH